MAFFSCLAIVCLLFSFSEARELKVGGNDGSWKFPSSHDDLNNWAAKQRFQIGDMLVFKYNGKTDSVLQVSEEAYKNCEKSKPIKEYHSGDSRVELDQSGPFYFISGIKDHCEKGQKLEVKVLSAGHHHSPAPSPSKISQAPSPSWTPLAPAPANDGHGLRNGFMGSVLVFGGLVGLALV